MAKFTMNITLLAKKGGVGKSTVSLLLYEAFKKAGKTTAIRDWDAQGTSNKALELIGGQRAESDTQYDILIYDTPPNLEHQATAAAVRSADVAIIVTTPSPADVWEAEEAVRFVKEKNDRAAVRVLFNKVRHGTLLGRLIDETAKTIGVQTVSISLTSRECYQHAIGRGWSALDAAAREEVLQLALDVMSLGK